MTMNSTKHQAASSGNDEMSRRSFFARVGAAGGVGLYSLAADRLAAAKCTSSKEHDLTSLSATKLAEMIRTKRCSSREVVETHLARIREVNPKIGAIFQVVEERALVQAQAADKALQDRNIDVGSFHGVPFSVKDNINTKGVVTTYGTLGLKANVPSEDATIVRRMMAAGAIMLGKTNMPELGKHYETDNLVYGRTRNPYDLERTPGGSSGGEAAIIAAGRLSFGLGW
jgi:Asp-tRNAAsn/Glu-tRNAGln amidotransferase A subunit and related amidases